MQLKYLIYFLFSIFLIGLVSATQLCYQESANTNNQTGIDNCFGRNYSGFAAVNSSWTNSYTEMYIINPQTKISSALLQYRIDNYTSSIFRNTIQGNLTIPQTCISQNTYGNILILVGKNDTSGNNQIVQVYCFNWSNNLYTNLTTSYFSNPSGGGGNNGLVNDGNWSTGLARAVSFWYDHGIGGDYFLFTETALYLNADIINITVNNATNTVPSNLSANILSLGATIKNVSLFTNISGSWEASNTTTGLSSNSVYSSYLLNITKNSTITYNFYSCLSTDLCSFGENKTITIDGIIPLINVNFPNNLINAVLSNSSYPTIQFNWTVNDTNLDKCWYNYNGTNVTKSCTSGIPILENISLNSQNYITLYANDTAGNLNTTIFIWNWNYTDSTTYSINWTNLPQNIYFYEAEVCDMANNCYTTTPERYYGLEESNMSLLINNLTRNITAELGSPILVNAHSNYGNICLDSDHPALGTNFVCSLYDLSYNTSFNWFRSTTNLVKSIFNSTDNVTIQVNSLDEVENLSLVLSGNATNLTIYKINTTEVDKYYKGTFNGTNVTDNTFSDFNISKSLTLVQNSPGSIYLIMDSNASNNTLTFNMTGMQYGDTFTDNLSTDVYLFSPLYTLYKGFLYPLTSIEKQNIAFENFTNTDNWVFSGNSLADYNNPPGYGGFGSLTAVSNSLALYTGVTVQSTSATNYNSATLNKSVFNLNNADNLTFRYYYSKTRVFNDLQGCTSTVYLGNTAIYAPQMATGGSDADVWPWGNANVTINVVRLNNTAVTVNLAGEDNFIQYINDGCTSGRDETRTTNKNYTSGLQTVTRGNCLPAHCTAGVCTTVTYLNNSYNYTIDYNNSQLTILNSAYAFSSGGGGDSITVYIYPITADSLSKTNSSAYTITSQSVLNKGYNILSATLNATYNGNISYYMAADGVNFESVTPGVEHTFLSPGGNIKWKAVMNASTSTNGFNLGGNSTNIQAVTITTPTSYPHNITIDYGGDGTIEALYDGEINDTRVVNLSNVSLNPSQYGVLDIGDSYIVPIEITSSTVGLAEFSNLSFIYNIGRVFLNITSLQNYLDNNSNGNINVTIPMSATTGQMNVTSVNYDFAGGNQTYYIKAHNEDYTQNITYWINNFYSRWGYNWNIPKVEFIQFSPKSPTAKNVSAYGQTNSTSIMNLTNKGYYNISGEQGKSDLYIYIANNNLTCVNMTVNYTSIKSPSYIVYNNWTLLKSNTLKGEITPIWIYADYNCSYSTWRYFQPTIYYRYCKVGTDICSEELE